MISSFDPDSDRELSIRLNTQLCFALYQASQLVTGLYRPLLYDIGLTYPQYLIMMLLWEQSPVPMGALCDNLSLDYNTLAPVARRLEEIGYVTRTQDPADARRMLVDLTAAGDALREKAINLRACVVDQLPLDSGELASMRESLQELNKALLSNNKRRRSPRR